jgi:thiosulfate/3-mercaptopyruvate sulfurtransferase
MELNFDVYGTTLRPENGTGQRARTALLQHLAIADETDVVAYDNDRNRWAARLVWFLRFLGHDRAAVLDGGLAAWEGTGGRVQRGENVAPEAPSPTVAPRTGYYVLTSELRDRLARPETALVDLRTDQETRDTDNGLLPRGRIPGAISVPWTETLRDGAGRLKAPDELGHLFAGRGITPERPVVVYARYGVEAAHGWWVLKLLAYPDVVVYDLGWAGWATMPGLPRSPLA